MWYDDPNRYYVVRHNLFVAFIGFFFSVLALIIDVKLPTSLYGPFIEKLPVICWTFLCFFMHTIVVIGYVKNTKHWLILAMCGLVMQIGFYGTIFISGTVGQAELAFTLFSGLFFLPIAVFDLPHSMRLFGKHHVR